LSNIHEGKGHEGKGDKEAYFTGQQIQAMVDK